MFSRSLCVLNTIRTRLVVHPRAGWPAQLPGAACACCRPRGGECRSACQADRETPGSPAASAMHSASVRMLTPLPRGDIQQQLLLVAVETGDDGSARRRRRAGSRARRCRHPHFQTAIALRRGMRLGDQGRDDMPVMGIEAIVLAVQVGENAIGEAQPDVLGEQMQIAVCVPLGRAVAEFAGMRQPVEEFVFAQGFRLVGERIGSHRARIEALAHGIARHGAEDVVIDQGILRENAGLTAEVAA